MKPTREQFSVSSIQRVENGMKITYQLLMGEQFDSITRKRDLFPVDEFLKDLNSLSKYVAKIIHYGSLIRIVGDTKFKITEDQSRYLTRLHQDLISKISINGIDLFCDADMIKKCTIRYSLSGVSGQNMDHKTYKIDLQSTFHDFEEELTELCDSLIEHSYEYLFEDKGSVGELFDEESEND